jgi:hypothetical protein
MFEGLMHIRINFKGRGHFINKSPDVKSEPLKKTGHD